MKDFADTLADFIIETERPRLNGVMKYVAEKIQQDMIGQTRALIDAYYQDYMPPEREYYVRTDEYHAKHMHPKNKKGQYRPKTKTEWRRSKDKSLRSAIEALATGDQPAMGICRPMTGEWGYQAGVLFDPGKFEGVMYHEQKGFEEWDIVENFLFGQHGNGSRIYFSDPYADIVLRNYIQSYKTKFDKHYKDALAKIK